MGGRGKEGDEEGGKKECEPGAGWIPLGSVGITEGHEAELQRAVVLLWPTAAERPRHGGLASPALGPLQKWGTGLWGSRLNGPTATRKQRSRSSACLLGCATGGPGAACGLRNLSHFGRINDSSII